MFLLYLFLFLICNCSDTKSLELDDYHSTEFIIKKLIQENEKKIKFTPLFYAFKAVLDILKYNYDLRISILTKYKETIFLDELAMWYFHDTTKNENKNEIICCLIYFCYGEEYDTNKMDVLSVFFDYITAMVHEKELCYDYENLSDADTVLSSFEMLLEIKYEKIKRKTRKNTKKPKQFNAYNANMVSNNFLDPNVSNKMDSSTSNKNVFNVMEEIITSQFLSDHNVSNSAIVNPHITNTILPYRNITSSDISNISNEIIPNQNIKSSNITNSLFPNPNASLHTPNKAILLYESNILKPGKNDALGPFSILTTKPPLDFKLHIDLQNKESNYEIIINSDDKITHDIKILNYPKYIFLPTFVDSRFFEINNKNFGLETFSSLKFYEHEYRITGYLVYSETKGLFDYYIFFNKFVKLVNAYERKILKWKDFLNIKYKPHYCSNILILKKLN